jgi:hypothetical protein
MSEANGGEWGGWLDIILGIWLSRGMETTTTPAPQVKEGDKIIDGLGVAVVTDSIPSVSEPGRWTIAAGWDGRLWAQVVDRAYTFEVVAR